MGTIEYVDRTWNPITGCSPISDGCANCWAQRMAKRLAGRCGYDAQEPFRPTFHPERLCDPTRWKKPQRVATCFMGDMFHEDVSAKWIWQVIDACWQARKHTFLFLTKRPQRIYDVLTRSCWWNNDTPQNIWLGVSIENQAAADERLLWLLQCPSAVRWISIEPMLGPITLHSKRCRETGDCPECPACLASIDWIVCGGESGSGARPMHPDWPRAIRDQCQAAGVPFWFKQWGEWSDAKNMQARFDNWNRQEIKVYGGPRHGLVFPVGYFPDKLEMARVGKKNAGCRLDGREWHELPATLARSST